jgi:hypothetical protein
MGKGASLGLIKQKVISPCAYCQTQSGFEVTDLTLLVRFFEVLEELVTKAEERNLKIRFEVTPPERR